MAGRPRIRTDAERKAIRAKHVTPPIRRIPILVVPDGELWEVDGHYLKVPKKYMAYCRKQHMWCGRRWFRLNAPLATPEELLLIKDHIEAQGNLRKKRFKEMRKNAAMTLADVAMAFGLTTSSICSIEKGHQKCLPYHVLALRAVVENWEWRLK